MSGETDQWRDVVGDFALVPVPSDAKRSMLNVFLVYSGVLAVFAFIAAGTALGLQYGIVDMLIVSFIGSLILIVVGSGIAYIGGVTSLSTYITMRYPFGYVGSWVWSAIVSGIPGGLGWFAFETWLFGVTMHALAPNAFWADVGVAAIWGGILMMLTAYYGYGGLSVLSYLAVPLFFLIAIAGIMVGLARTESLAALAALEPNNPAAGIGAGVTTVVGTYIVGASITMDIGRFARKAWHAAAAWGVQILFFMPLVMAGAGLMTLVTGKSDFAAVMLAAGMGLGVFLMALFGFWSTNDNNLYVGALAWSLFIPLKKKNIVILQGIIGTGIAAYVGFSAGASMDPFLSFLLTLGKVIPAVAGVILGDFYLYRWYKGQSRHERYEYEPGQEYGLFVWPGWLAAIAGSWIGGWVLTSGIASLNVLVLAAAFHTALMIGCDLVGISKKLGSAVIDETGQSPEVHERIPGAGTPETAETGGE